jgi:hypothetical protein
VSSPVSVAVSCRSVQTLPRRAASSSVSTAVSSPVSVAVSRSAHHCAMIRLRSTHNDHPTSVSPRTTRHPATIEPARARHSLDDVVRLASHGHFDRSPSLRLHLDDGIRHYLGCGQAGWHRRVGVPERRCGMASGDPHPRLRPHARTRVRRTRIVALAQGLFFKPTPGGKVLRDSHSGYRDDPWPSHSGDR